MKTSNKALQSPVFTARNPLVGMCLEHSSHILVCLVLVKTKRGSKISCHGYCDVNPSPELKEYFIKDAFNEKLLDQVGAYLTTV